MVIRNCTHVQLVITHNAASHSENKTCNFPLTGMHCSQCNDWQVPDTRPEISTSSQLPGPWKQARPSFITSRFCSPFHAVHMIQTYIYIYMCVCVCVSLSCTFLKPQKNYARHTVCHSCCPCCFLKCVSCCETALQNQVHALCEHKGTHTGRQPDGQIYTHTHTHIHTHIHTHTHTHTEWHSHVHTHTYTHTHRVIFTFTHTHTHTHTHTLSTSTAPSPHTLHLTRSLPGRTSPHSLQYTKYWSSRTCFAQSACTHQNSQWDVVISKM